MRGGVWEQWLLKDLFWSIPGPEGRKGHLPTPPTPRIPPNLIFGGSGRGRRPEPSLLHSETWPGFSVCISAFPGSLSVPGQRSQADR